MPEISRTQIFKGRDPFTAPHTMVEMVNTSIPWVKTPVIRYQWLNIEVDLIVEGPDRPEVVAKFNDCLKVAEVRAAVAGIAAGYATTPMGGVAAALVKFVHEMDACMASVLQPGETVTAAAKTVKTDWDTNWS